MFRTYTFIAAIIGRRGQEALTRQIVTKKLAYSR